MSKKREKKKNYNRIPWIDLLRGLTVISMFFYHWMWDVVFIHGGNYPWYTGPIGYIWQQSICWSFIILAGFCVCIGRHPIRRGIIVFALGALISIITCYVLPRVFVSGVEIRFGVLTLIGTSMIIAGILNPLLKKIHPAIGILVFAALFVITRNVNGGFLGFEGLRLAQIPEALYNNNFSAFLGFPPAGFYSVDYFSLMPWFFLFMVGYYLYKIYKGVRKPTTYSRGVPVLGTIGRGSLYIYIIHQPLITLILFLVYGNGF